MRLTPSQQQAITSILRSVDPLAEVLLFGSRADDQRKGGDLDIQLKNVYQSGAFNASR
jgi:uncharacterized protein